MACPYEMKIYSMPSPPSRHSLPCFSHRSPRSPGFIPFLLCTPFASLSPALRPPTGHPLPSARFLFPVLSFCSNPPPPDFPRLVCVADWQPLAVSHASFCSCPSPLSQAFISTSCSARMPCTSDPPTPHAMPFCPPTASRGWRQPTFIPFRASHTILTYQDCPQTPYSCWLSSSTRTSPLRSLLLPELAPVLPRRLDAYLTLPPVPHPTALPYRSSA